MIVTREALTALEQHWAVVAVRQQDQRKVAPWYRDHERGRGVLGQTKLPNHGLATVTLHEPPQAVGQRFTARA